MSKILVILLPNLLAMSIACRNLKYLRKLRGWTQEEFAAKLKIKRSLLGAYEEERADPRIEVLETVGNIFKLTLDDLLRKDLGESKNPNGYLAKRRAMKLAAASNEIQLVPVKAAAGYLAGYGDPEFLDELNTFTLPMLAPGNYRAFEIVGDSMLPTPSGSVIVGEKVSSTDDVKSNDTYIVVSKGEGIVYKRVMKNNKLKNKLTLVSDNTAYQPYNVNTEDVIELWKAQMIISKANTQQRWDVNQLASLVSNLQEQVSVIKKKMN
ncbi:MAG TPA: LexA family transcriptional regulator [Puia sp.]|nr:LexA family transcriptional regulator [Puia sp.]